MPGAFLTVVCTECENEQIVFEKASTEVSCAACDSVLARPAGGKAAIEHEITDVVSSR